MKTVRIIFVVCAAVLWGVQGLGAQKVYTVDDVPNVQLADRDNFVSNPDGTLSPDTVAEINREIAALRRETSIEVAVVAVSSIGEMPPEDFGIRLFRKWGIGKKDKDNGLLILLVTDDRIIRFEVGYGLEGVLTDALSKRIQTVRMMPYLREGDWNWAMLEAVRAVREYLTDPDSDLRSEPERSGGGSALWFFPLMVFGLFAGMIMLGYAANRRRNKCPKCGAQMKVVDVKEERLSSRQMQRTETLRCPKCGNVVKRVTRYNTGGMGGAVGGGMIGGGMAGGFGRGGGGFGGGGSWGGGSAGGGGATTRF